MATWRHQSYGSEEDPIRQSDLSDLAGDYGCAKRFEFRKRAEAEGIAAQFERAAGKTVKGTAVHETLKAYLSGAHGVRVLAGEVPRPEAVRAVYDRELQKAATTSDGRLLPIEWYGDDPEKMAAECVTMVHGVLADMPARASKIVAVEAPFLAQIGKYWLKGTIDVAYRPRAAPETLGLLDWKTGEQRLSQIILDHGYQTGIYAHALHTGVLFPNDENRAFAPAAFPSEIFIVHLRDYLPYTKRQSKTIDRPEEVEFFGYPKGTKIQVECPGAAAEEDEEAPSIDELIEASSLGSKAHGKKKPRKKAPRRCTDPLVVRGRRGPGWYAARRHEEDVARLAVSIRNIVSTVRLGRFVEFIGEPCVRCPFKATCLTEGYGPDKEEAREIEQALKGVEFDIHTKDFAA